MLTFLNIAQVVLYVALLSLMGQGVLFVLAGAKRETNFFYTLLRLLARPFTLPVRWLVPKVFSDQQVGWLTFVLLLVASFVVFVERGFLLCEQLGHTGCRG
jgi:ABC-type multidrug transport system permease subunit